MVEYHITRVGNMPGVRKVLGKHCIIRHRVNAAIQLFYAAVHEMVRDHASLDTEHGVRAQMEARRLCPLTLNALGHVRIEHQGEAILIERIA